MCLSGECPPCPPPANMVLVSGGEFEMGDCFDEGWGDELPVHTLYISPFYMDVCEVTNTQYCGLLEFGVGAGADRRDGRRGIQGRRQRAVLQHLFGEHIQPDSFQQWRVFG